MKLFRVLLRLYIWKRKNKEKGANQTMKQFTIIGIDPTRYWSDGYGYWRDEDGRVFVDNVLVCPTKEEAYWVSLDNGQICYLFVDLEGEPNGYLVKAEAEELKSLFEAEKITGYTVFHKKPKDDLPQVFTIVDGLEGLPAKLQKTAKPVFYEFVYVK
jgi:hypothetical protein